MQELDEREQAARKADQGMSWLGSVCTTIQRTHGLGTNKEALQRLHQQELEKERESLKATLESERRKQEERINQYMGQLQRQGSFNSMRRGPQQQQWGPPTSEPPGGPSPANSARAPNYASPFSRMPAYQQDLFPQPPAPSDPFETQPPGPPAWGMDPHAAAAARRQHMEREQRARMMQQHQQQQQQRSRSDPAFGDDVFGVPTGPSRSFEEPAGRQGFSRGAAPMREPSRFICVTTDSVPGLEVVNIVGPVQASVQRDERAGLADDRQRASHKMMDEAKQLGANAILGMKFDAHAPSGVQVTEVAVYGTACVVRPMAAPQRGRRGERRHRRRRSYSDASDEVLSEEEPDRRDMFPPQEDIFGTSLGGGGQASDLFEDRSNRKHRNKGGKV